MKFLRGTLALLVEIITQSGMVALHFLPIFLFGHSTTVIAILDGEFHFVELSIELVKLFRYRFQGKYFDIKCLKKQAQSEV